jgi:hypothetical protein
VSRAILINRGKATVEISGDLLEAVDRAVRESMPITIAAMEAATAEVLAAARPLWPVKTGRSLAAFREITRLPTPEEIETSILNDAQTRKGIGYAVLIKTRPDYSPWQELVRKPLLDRADSVATQAAAEIAATFGGSIG